MRRLCAALACVILAGPAFAQDRAQTLADIRQELSVLYVELQRLGQELNTTGGAGGTGASGSMLQRMDALEAEIRRLASLTEDLQIRVDSVVRDGTNRVGDLEFRLCELEADCDIASLGETPNLGGVEPSGAAPSISVTPDTGSAPQLAVAEQDDFDRARAAFEAGTMPPHPRRSWPSPRPIPAARSAPRRISCAASPRRARTPGARRRAPISTVSPRHRTARSHRRH
jgi:hypothetical protein